MLVIGAGVVGQLVSRLAMLRGAAVNNSEPVPCRRAIAAGAGITAIMPDQVAQTVAAATDGRGADAVIECPGMPALVRIAVEQSRPGCTIVLVGSRRADAQIPPLATVLGERRLVGSAAYRWDSDVTAAVRLVAHRAVDQRRCYQT